MEKWAFLWHLETLPLSAFFIHQWEREASEIVIHPCLSKHLGLDSHGKPRLLLCLQVQLWATANVAPAVFHVHPPLPLKTSPNHNNTSPNGSSTGALSRVDFSIWNQHCLFPVKLALAADHIGLSKNLLIVASCRSLSPGTVLFQTFCSFSCSPDTGRMIRSAYKSLSHWNGEQKQRGCARPSGTEG